MKYPFEKISNYKSDFLNPKDKEIFSDLQYLINEVDKAGVDAWFVKHASYLKVKGKENLAKAIGNTTYYFVVQSTGFMTKEQIESKKSQQYNILLKHFNLQQQFSILTQVYDFEDQKLFELLYQTAKKEKKQEQFYQSRIILDPLFKLFHKENFELLKKIETIIEKNIVDVENNFMAFFKDSGGSYYNKLNNKYSVTDEIILNYSENKKEFILSYNKELPLKNKAYRLLEDIQEYYKTKNYLSKFDTDNISAIISQTDKYIKTIMYFDLNKKLPPKSIKNITNKI